MDVLKQVKIQANAQPTITQGKKSIAEHFDHLFTLTFPFLVAIQIVGLLVIWLALFF